MLEKVVNVINTSVVPNPKYILLYNGANNENFFLSHREFTIDDLARPAFTQEVVYQKKDRLVRFKNLTIETERADNKVMVYRVLGDEGNNGGPQ